MSKLIYLFVLFILCNQVKCDKPTKRILYGTEVKIEEYPYYAGLKGCGAAIISDRWILTAAHCVSNPRSSKDVFFGGESFQNSQRIPSDKIIIHPEYNESYIPIHDIAVIRLSKPLTFTSKIKSIALPTAASSSSNAVFVGRGIDESGKISRNLKKLDLVKMTIDECINRIPREYKQLAQQYRQLLETINICATRRENKPGICNGDSGSPLSINNVLVGLASYSGHSCEKSRIGFYVNVLNYVPWIKSVTGL